MLLAVLLLVLDFPYIISYIIYKNLREINFHLYSQIPGKHIVYNCFTM